jgi:hypothetical protein
MKMKQIQNIVQDYMLHISRINIQFPIWKISEISFAGKFFATKKSNTFQKRFVIEYQKI